ncbi:MAG: hypothetical protein KBC42_02765 [Candidatus Pacebacteria bacterium]|nr:hypothetical protein [Candidatus Paceibacterota bacterium]MBP9780823.1 hypothetical protein [Candidatus Paceibacterota bacterium]
MIRKKELKGYRIHRFNDETGILIPEGSIFLGSSSRQRLLTGDIYTFYWVTFAVPLSAYTITKKIRQKNKVKSTEYTFELKPILETEITKNAPKSKKTASVSKTKNKR